ncbi:MAG: DUF3089 domain-containing protein [Sphingobacteriales bacterium]|nr:MAG: DUF3089 domain-containing protein [Sphingobacteriales bacterium]
MGRLLFLLFLLQKVAFAQVTDYAQTQNWAALPQVSNNSNWTPNTSIKNNQSIAKADVFYIHPTTDIYGLKISGNTSLDNDRVNKQTDELCIQYQASVFNAACKVYAPRYQQAVLHNFFARNSDKSKEAFNTAYQDIKAAFEYYLKNYNQGRPIVIAGHSQGSMHAARLLKDFFDGKDLHKQLVAAYLIGYPTFPNQFQYLKVAEHADSLGAIISYNAFLLGTDGSFSDAYKGAMVVNPLSWNTTNEFVDASKNLGGIKKNKNEIFPKLLGAKCGNGILEIQKPNISGYVPLLKNNYHIHDYSLFYMNIRENVEHRVNLFLNKNN